MTGVDDSGTITVARIIARLNVGGPAIQAILLTEELAASRFRPILITGQIGELECDMMPVARQRAVDPLVVPELGRELSGYNDVVAFWKLLGVLRRLEPHIVHTHTAKAGFLGRIAARLAGVPVRVHTFHGHVFHGYFGPTKTKLFILLERWLARTTDRIIAISEGQRDELSTVYRIGDPRKYSVIPLGFDLEPFIATTTAGALRAELGMPSDAFVIGFVGRLVAIKNPLLLFRALDDLTRHVARQYEAADVPARQIRLIVVGGGELEQTLRQHAQTSGLDEQVTFMGWQREMARIYADVDVVVLTSTNEGTPVALIEAMASEKPFIATDVGGVPDLMVGAPRVRTVETGGRFAVYDNGILVRAEDVGGLVAALDFVRTNRDEGRRMGRVGRQFATVRFGKERLVRDIRRLYEDLLEEKRVARVQRKARR